MDGGGNIGVITVSIISAIISLTAIIVSILAFKKSHQLNKRMLEIEENRENDRLSKQRTTNLVAVLTRGNSGSGQLIIQNRGNSSADNVKVRLNGKYLNELDTFSANDFPEDICIAAEGIYSLRMDYNLSTPKSILPPFNTEITWRNMDKSDGYAKSTVNWI